MNPGTQNLRATLTTWPFVASVITLILNDAWLKGAYPGVLSGKLSDFAGVAIVTWLLLAVWPRRPWRVYAAVFIGFAWWKSPLSQPVIDAANLLLPVAIGRVVDYSDLLACLVMPLCARIALRPSAFAIPGHTLRRLLIAPVAGLTVFGLMATSQLPVIPQDYRFHKPVSTGDLDRQAVANTVATIAERHGFKCFECDTPESQGEYRADLVTFKYSFTDDRTIAFQITIYMEGLIFVESGESEAIRFRDDLKRQLASLYPGLEYVEILGEWTR
jgi:hypothetical protein